jgi:exopolyphosphatase / guanosine-5'-triphosphate,3'-diphosphate pyrophosphatase
MRICVLDLGGLSFHLLHARVLGTSELVRLSSLRLPTRLGSQTMQTGVLSPASWETGLKDLGRLCEEARMLAPDRIVVVATSAFRAASNAHAFVAAARELFAVDISVLSPEREAELTYGGVLSAEPMGAGSLAVVDLGGGSCEVALGNGREYRQSYSADIGVLTLRDAFQIEDSVGPIKMGAITEVIRMALQPAREIMARAKPERVIFASGTARAVARLARSVLGEVLPPGQISLAQASELRKYVLNRQPRQFLEHDVDAHRADVIAIAAIALETLMTSFQCLQAEFSTRGLREGVALASGVGSHRAKRAAAAREEL